MSKHIQFSLIQAKKSHELRRVPILLPALCRVIEGKKILYCDSGNLCAGRDQIILMSAGTELTIANHPNEHGYIAEFISFSPQLIHNFFSKFSELQPTKSHSRFKNCIAIDTNFIMVWENLKYSLIKDMPSAMQEYYAYGVFLTLVLAGQSISHLINAQASVSTHVQQTLLLDPAFAWTVEDVATRLHMGSSTLRRKLTHEKKSFREILEDVRLGIALNQIQTTNQPIAFISDACGYSSASKFSQRFRLRYGISPSTLRKTM